MPATRVLVLGASGYVGGRLVPKLLEAGYEVRCLARTPSKLSGVGWADRVEVVEGDLLRRDTLDEAFVDVDVVYHLVHSMGSGRGHADFAEADRRIAHNVADAAAAGGARRIVYLGGLGENSERTSVHLRSRAEVGEILLGSQVPTTVLRAAVIVGSGSASFEMLRHLVEKLPVMVAPRWVSNRVQPIAIRDVLRVLVGVIEVDDGRAHVYDLGGPDVLTYLEMMHGYAEVAGLPRRLVVPVPLLTPKLSSHWIGLVTPVPTGVAKPLVASLVEEVVVQPDGEDVTEVVPGTMLGYAEAVRLALSRVRDAEVETSWREAELAAASPAEPYPGDPHWAGGTLLSDVAEVEADAPPEETFAVLSAVGGDRGWPVAGWAWTLRGWIDQLVGGVGLRRGRRDPRSLRVGDAVDFWRVEEVRAPSADDRSGLLRLRAEMRLPGRAWLEWRLAPRDGGTHLTQRALFAPKGLFGRAYWWAMLPFHALIFGRMAIALAREADRMRAGEAGDGGVTSSGERTGAPVAPAGRAGRRRGGRRRSRSGR